MRVRVRGYHGCKNLLDLENVLIYISPSREETQDDRGQCGTVWGLKHL